LGDYEEDAREIWKQSLLVRIILYLYFVFTIVMIYLLTNCFINNSSGKNCIGETIMTCIVIIVSFVLLFYVIRWSLYKSMGSESTPREEKKSKRSKESKESKESKKTKESKEVKVGFEYANPLTESQRSLQEVKVVSEITSPVTESQSIRKISVVGDSFTYNNPQHS
jgi:hypothetical protein